MNFGKVHSPEISSAMLLSLVGREHPFPPLGFWKQNVNSDRDPCDPRETQLLRCWVGSLRFGATFLEKLDLKVEWLIYQVVKSLDFCFWLHKGLGVSFGHQ